MRLLTCLHLVLIHLNEHKFRHSFADCGNTFYSCNIKPETTLHFFRCCRNFDKIKILDETLFHLNDQSLLTALPFGSEIYNENMNKKILNASIGYIIDSDRFTGSLI